MPSKLTYVDLFAGCGGLSLGLEKAGFELALAVEKSPMAAETFFHNFIEPIRDEQDFHSFVASPLEQQACKRLVVDELGAVLACAPLLSRLKAQTIDLVAGGPPCQGFSLAGRRDPDDIRNKLPWQFLEFVTAIEPKAVLIENVSGMRQDFKKRATRSPFEDLRLALEQAGPGYVVQPALLNAMHFGVPQHRPRIMLFALRRDLAERAGIMSSTETWNSAYEDTETLLFKARPSMVPEVTHTGDSKLTVADALKDISRTGYKKRVRPSAYAAGMRAAVEDGRALQNHVLRRHAEQTETRFRLYQYLRDVGIPPRVLAIPKQEGMTRTDMMEHVKIALNEAKLPAVAPDSTVLAEDMNGLAQLVMQLGTKKHSQWPLSWDKPSPTVVSVPDDYVHPSEPRVLTVREMARLQSFPDHFEFRAKETTGSMRRRVEVPQYTQVGNAVPPRLGRAAGESIKAALISATQREQQPIAKAAV